jgi:large subunit ribosomal protein L9
MGKRFTGLSYPLLLRLARRKAFGTICRRALYPSLELCRDARQILCQKGLDKMKVMLIKDVYKLGRAGDVKKVAAGYGRNFLIPQGLAVLATPGALKQVERIRAQAEIHRAEQNKELQGLADEIAGTVLTFAAKAGETDKLYGSITTQMVAEALEEKTRYEVKRHQIDMQPIRNLGEFTANVRLTIDLTPEIKIIVYREGEALEEPAPIDEVVADEPPVPEAVAEEAVAEEPAEEEVPATEDTVAEEEVPDSGEDAAGESEEPVAEEETPEEDKE